MLDRVLDATRKGCRGKAKREVTPLSRAVGIDNFGWGLFVELLSMTSVPYELCRNVEGDEELQTHLTFL